MVDVPARAGSRGVCLGCGERDERRRQALERHAAFMEQRRQAVHEVDTWVRLSAGAGRLAREAAERAGMRPEEVLAQLVERVAVDADGTVSVPPFTPHR
ncbi:hypothetical protein [Streptomyces sp. NPDC049585]|uniref:hypothetical protein n=1 Tax=Streptomyces sp. NPDC049585 TaxID=3155154 RepID=UPI00344AFBBA